MQTFLPYEDFVRSASVLDRQRLGKQRVEVLQILQVLAGIKQGWKNHPAVKMWKNYEEALIVYGITVCDEWTSRGYRDSCRNKIKDFSTNNLLFFPPWLGSPLLHLSHQSNLLRKFPDYYKTFFPTVPNNLPYFWPV